MCVGSHLRIAVAVTLAGAAFCSETDDLARAYDLQRKGSLKSARAIYESVISRLQPAGNSTLMASAMRRLSEVDLAEGKNADALMHASQCASLSHKLTASAIEVDCLSVAGRAQIFSGDYLPALDTHERALAVAKARHFIENEIALLNNIGGIYFFLGRYADSYRAYLDAQSLLNGNKHETWYGRRQQLTLANLATLYQQLGQYQRALDLYAQIRTIAGTMQPPEQAILLANVGTLYRRLGDPVKAIETYRQAQQQFATGRNNDGEIGVVKNTGIALALDMGDLKTALVQFNTALEMANQSGNRRQAVQAHLYLGETFWRLDHLNEARKHFEAALTGAQGLGSSEDQWKALYGLGRIFERAGSQQPALERYQAAIAIIESLRSRIGAATLQTGFLADKRDVYDSLIGLLLDDPASKPEGLVRIIEGAKARTFQDRIKRGSGIDSDSGHEVGIASIASKLDAGTVLLDFWIGGGKAAAVWITRSGSGIARLQTPSSAQLESFKSELSNGSGGAWRAAAARLGDSLLTPLAAQLNNATQVVIVPDGQLQTIPFEIFSVPGSSGKRLLIEQFAVSYVPSLSAIQPGPISAVRSWSPPWRRELVAFADPTVRGSQRDSLVPSGLVALPASRAEVRSIASILGGRSEIHSGADDRKRYVNGARLHGVPVLHLSTHAVADASDADRSRLVFSPESNGQTADFLFAREISSLNLSGVGLATLAACDTEGGKNTVGEGVQSFSRAFLEAGAASVVTTLWRIGDQSTAEFMKQFYTQLANGQPAAEALREAKLAFYRSNSTASHPMYWAAFVLNGNPHTTTPRAIPWIAVIAPVALVVGILAVAVLRTRGSAAPPSTHSDPQRRPASEQVRSS